ncbi:MAG: hypothetical protein HY764_02495 [Candidatus Portnoybacteria bacterium]|nr:hypothetical protein [Candidatus Portnoybacteria bacterium]
MSEIDKDLCLQIYKRGARPHIDCPRILSLPETRKKEIFRGSAKNWGRFSEIDFQQFMPDKSIRPETEIAIADLGDDNFAVIRVWG